MSELLPRQAGLGRDVRNTTAMETPRAPRMYGPEYGPEAIRRLEAGYSICYMLDGELVEEYPSGERYVIRVEDDGSATHLRRL
jgi:hypothetical protein